MQIDRFTHDDLDRLAEYEGPHAVSIFLPTEVAGREVRQNPLRLKNLMKQAGDQLERRGLGGPEAERRLAPADALLDDAEFWNRQGDGLALFLGDGVTWRWRLPRPFSQRVVADQQFYLIPLFPVVADDARFFVLALSPKSIRLLECTRCSQFERRIPDLPETFEEIRRHWDVQSQLQYHTGAAPGEAAAGRAADRAAVFHGQGAGGDDADRKIGLTECCRVVEKQVGRVLAEERAPLVLACDDNLLGIYREVNRYSRLPETPLNGSPDDIKPEELRRRAWTVVEPEVEAPKSRARVAFGEAAAKDRGSDQLDQVLPAAAEGRVDTLLVAEEAECWGRFDPAGRQVHVGASEAGGDRELCNLAALDTFTRGGRVVVMPGEEMPSDSPLAAVFRY